MEIIIHWQLASHLQPSFCLPVTLELICFHLHILFLFPVLLALQTSKFSHLNNVIRPKPHLIMKRYYYQLTDLAERNVSSSLYTCMDEQCLLCFFRGVSVRMTIRGCFATEGLDVHVTVAFCIILFLYFLFLHVHLS